MTAAHAFFSLRAILWCSKHIALSSFSSQPILYSYFRSSCSWRVRIGKIQCWSPFFCLSIAVSCPSLTQLINHLLTERSANMNLEQWGISPQGGRGTLQLTWGKWNRGEQIRGLSWYCLRLWPAQVLRAKQGWEWSLLVLRQKGFTGEHMAPCPL